MVVHDFNIQRGTADRSLLPAKADSPLIVDTDTVLPFAIALERLKMITRRNPQIGNGTRLIEVKQLAPRYPLDRPKAWHHTIMEQGFGVAASKRFDHGFSVLRTP